MKSEEKGIVLIMVLVLLGAISFMVAYLNFKVHRDIKEFISQKRNNEIRLFAPLLAQKIIESLLLYQKNYDSVPQKMHFEYQAEKFFQKGSFDISLSLEADRLNINQAKEKELIEFFEDIDIPPQKVLVMTRSLLDWIDEDDLPRLGGAEKESYLELGYEPPNKPLNNFYEIQLIRGFDPYLFWVNPRLFDYVTIFASKGENKQKSKILVQKEKNEEEQSEQIFLREGEIYRLNIVWKENNQKVK